MLTPATKANVWTRLDETGALYGITRRPGEDLVSLKRRILLAFVDTMNATTNGLTNSLLSQFGLDKIRVIKITLRDEVSSNDFPKRAVLKIDNQLLICKHFNSLTDYVEDYTIELRERPFITIPDIVTLINANSSLYSAELLSSDIATGYGSNDYLTIAKGFTIINMSNQGRGDETIGRSTLTKLQHQKIQRGSLMFNDTNSFNTEIYDEVYLENNTSGYYYVDYDNGTIQTVTVPSAESRVVYNFTEEPFYLYHSPVVVSSIVSIDAAKYLFDEKPSLLWTSDANKTFPTTPKQEMLDIVYELKRAARIYWGE